MYFTTRDVAGRKEYDMNADACQENANHIHYKMLARILDNYAILLEYEVKLCVLVCMTYLSISCYRLFSQDKNTTRHGKQELKMTMLHTTLTSLPQARLNI